MMSPRSGRPTLEMADARGMKLFWSTRSPYARKVMVAALERGLGDLIDCVPATVSLTASPVEVTAVNPLGQIPTLVLSDGRAIYDSLVICEYLDQLGEAGPLIPRDPPARIEVLQRHALAQGMLDAMVHWRAERRRLDDELKAVYRDAYRAKAVRALDCFETAQLEGRPTDIADIALACALAYADFREVEAGWREGRPNLDAWNQRFAARRSMRRTEFTDKT